MVKFNKLYKLNIKGKLEFKMKIFLIFLFMFVLFSVGKSVQANSINKISMDIFIDNNGDAHITEIWNCYVNEGTEVYHPYYNLGNSEIKNLSVGFQQKKGTVKSCHLP